MGEFVMPSLGADMEDGTLLEWLVAPGAPVARGDIVAVVKTDKADVEVEVFETGIVGELLVPEGTKVPVGTPLATIVAPGGEPTPPPADAPSARAEVAPAPAAAPTPAAPVAAAAAATPAPAVPSTATPEGTASAAPPPAAPARSRPRVSPHARRRAQELGIDLALVTAGSGAVVTADDVERAAAARSRPRDEADERLAGMRRAIAAAMTRSHAEIPHYHLLHHTPLSHALAWLEHTNAARPIDERIVPAALFYRATALAAREVPGLNGFWRDGAFAPSEAVHLGVAIAVRGGGLVAPAIRDADRLALPDLMAALRDLTARARGGRLRGSELAAATITVTNLGDRGVEAVHGLIYPPQVALVGFGRVVERPWAEDGVLAARPVVAVTLAGDHRASDGHLGARFLATIDRLLREVEAL